MSTRSASQQLKVGLCSPPCTMMRIPCPKTVAARRGYQDYEYWKNYLCKGQWDEIEAKPNMAGEIIVTQMHKLGLKNPSEQTSAAIAGGIAAAEHGENVSLLSAQDMKKTFMFVKAQSLFQGNIYSRRAKLAVTTAGGSPRIVIIAMAWANNDARATSCGCNRELRTPAVYVP